MIIEETEIFKDWFDDLMDEKAKDRIAVRIDRIESENYFGEYKSVGEKVFELKINYGPGYRIYFIYKGRVVVLLLCGGDKKSQKKDIKKAQVLAKEILK